jgi:hypothetical protein
MLSLIVTLAARKVKMVAVEACEWRGSGNIVEGG